jgi:hypothetical protein
MPTKPLTPPLLAESWADRESQAPSPSPKLNRILSILILFASITIRHASAPDKLKSPHR